MTSPTLPTLTRRGKILIGVGVGILALLLVGPRLVGVTTDWLWFSDLGYRSTYTTIFWTRVAIFVVVALVVAALIATAVFAAYRSRPIVVSSLGAADPLANYRAAVSLRPKLFALIPAVAFGLIAGLLAQASWSTVQMFLHGEDFGVKDPQFGKDIGFYAFDLGFYRMVLSILTMTVIIAFIANLATHYVFGGVRLGGNGVRGGLTSAARIQLAIIAGSFLILKAFGYWLDRYTLLSSDRRAEIFSGAGYTDINAVLPSKLILLAIAVICAVAFFAGAVLRDLRIPALATALMLLSSLLIGVGWPAVMEQFSVKPNAQQKEAEYISRNIAATRHAYGIDKASVTYEPNWTSVPPDPAAVNSDEATLSNIRLLDPNVVEPAFAQRNRLRNFYGFPSQLAIDRYTVNGQSRDFIVAARELDPSRLADNQRDWINKHTVFTHGNGFIAAQANTVDSAASTADSDSGGLPVFLVSDLDTIGTPAYRATAPIKVKQPRIYFGELIAKQRPDYAIVGSSSGPKEYDEEGKTYTYTGGSGVSLGNWFSRLLYSVKYAERNILLSSVINENSKILYNRDPRDRVKSVAPWLTVDSKTYPAVMADGSIKWIVDGYTTLDRYPYAQPTSLQNATTDVRSLTAGQTARVQADREVSYVRNSVKATVDAYTGKVELFQVDGADPVLKTWMKVFPGTVKPLAEFEKRTDLRNHVRYPEDLFKIQRALLAKYHVDDPTEFFRGSDFWSIPADPTADQTTSTPQTPANPTPADLRRQAAAPQPEVQAPYYFTAAAPGDERQSQFQLTTVLTVLRNPYLAAYVTASSDPGSYGKLTVKMLPVNKQYIGPRQAQDKMKNATANERKLLEGTVDTTFGNLLTLPVGRNGVLYVEPLYTQSKNADSAVPKLYRVMVSYNDKVAFAPTLAGALRQVGIDPAAVTPPEHGAPGAPAENRPQPAADQPPAPSAARDAAVAELNSALQQLRTAQQSGDFKAYGEALDRLKRAVDKYESLPK
ncbi:UPF0182 family protein [Gordonia crocea]|uniref:UPF0182 protein nbrc107697_29570 n=1 Tax=Gordonia crocea TaxID=589162 RepID=A0A7I9V0G3_9ACTN|nr:UPF0182 family protein [Gordonia crocea]GED98918.1 UPF0182 protein [Gordonia crocea]